MSVVVAQNLGKVFHDRSRGPVHAVRGVSFEARAGEVFGLLGPNGAGKTTTLRMLSTILAPTSGRASVAGHDIAASPAAVRASIGYLSGDTGLYGRLTPREVLRYFGRLNAYPDRELNTRVDELVERFSMESFASVRCDRLSTGMRQKVSIARAVVHDPPVLILDEPTAGLDIIVAEGLLRFIQEIRDAGKCVIFSTHIMREAERLCDRIGILHEGELLAVETFGELQARTGKRYLEEIFVDLVERGRGAAL
ncbi:MAG: ABC transporter ATP-binding protein [bacterium]